MSATRPTEAEIDAVVARLATTAVTEGDEIVVFVDRASVGPALEHFLAARSASDVRPPSEPVGGRPQ